MNKTIGVKDISNELGIKCIGDDVRVWGINLCNRKTIHDSILSYVTGSGFIDEVRNNHSISALVISDKDSEFYSESQVGREMTYIISEDPEATFYFIHDYLCRIGFYEEYQFQSSIGKHCEIDGSAVIQKGVVIGDYVKVGANSVIRSGSIIDNNTEIGCNTTIGSEGFQIIVQENNPPLHIRHVGRCHIDSNVYIGDNTCVCNALFEGETYVGKGAKIDNLCHVAHNLRIGENAVITAHVILCGSAVVEDGAWIGPNSSVLNRIIIGSGAKVGMGSVVTRNVAPFSVVYGNPARTHDNK